MKTGGRACGDNPAAVRAQVDDVAGSAARVQRRQCGARVGRRACAKRLDGHVAEHLTVLPALTSAASSFSVLRTHLLQVRMRDGLQACIVSAGGGCLGIRHPTSRLEAMVWHGSLKNDGNNSIQEWPQIIGHINSVTTHQAQQTYECRILPTQASNDPVPRKGEDGILRIRDTSMHGTTKHVCWAPARLLTADPPRRCIREHAHPAKLA